MSWPPSIFDPMGRSQLHQVICQRLHGESPYVSHEWPLAEDHSYRHTNVPLEFLRALFKSLKPSYLLAPRSSLIILDLLYSII